MLEDESMQGEDLLAQTHDSAVLRSSLSRALDELSVRERLIVRERQLSDTPRTLESLGLELHLSKERIRQLEAAAYGKLRRSLEAEGAQLSHFLS